MQVAQDDGEFIATGARQVAWLAQAALQAAHDFLQPFIAGFTAELLVELGKVVQVDIRHRQGAVVLQGLLHAMVEHFAEQYTVGQAGQGVMALDIAELLLMLLVLGDVDIDTHHQQWLLLLVALHDTPQAA